MQSGPALIQLLRTELRPILRREDGNRDAMHLYSLGTWWAAFESSAFQLALRCPGAVILPLRLKDVPYPVLRLQPAAGTAHAPRARPGHGEVPAVEKPEAGVVPERPRAGRNRNTETLNNR